PYEDEIVAELSRSLTSIKIGNIQFVAGVSIAEIAALVETLRLPIPVIDRAGGAGKLLRERGVQTIALQDLGVVQSAGRSSTGVERVIETLYTAPDQLAARLAETAGGGVLGTAQSPRAPDRSTVRGSRAVREIARKS